VTKSTPQAKKRKRIRKRGVLGEKKSEPSATDTPTFGKRKHAVSNASEADKKKDRLQRQRTGDKKEVDILGKDKKRPKPIPEAKKRRERDLGRR